MSIVCQRLFQAPKLQKNNETPPLFIASPEKYPQPTCRRRQTATRRAAPWSSLTLCLTAAAPRCSPTPGRQTVGSIALQPYPGAAIRCKAGAVSKLRHSLTFRDIAPHDACRAPATRLRAPYVTDKSVIITISLFSEIYSLRRGSVSSCSRHLRGGRQRFTAPRRRFALLLLQCSFRRRR